MTQAERDRLAVLKKTRKGLLTQKEAAQELEVSERQVRRMLGRLKEVGDKSMIHSLKGKPSNRKIDDAIRTLAVEALSHEKCHDFGPAYARDYLASKKISVSKETTRRWMKEEELWRPSKSKLEKKLHVWRQRRSRFVKSDYTFQFAAKTYVIEQADIGKGLRGAAIRIEKRRNGSMAIRVENRYLRYKPCEIRPKVAPANSSAENKNKAKRPASKSTWMEGLLDKNGSSLGKAIAVSNCSQLTGLGEEATPNQKAPDTGKRLLRPDSTGAGL